LYTVTLSIIPQPFPFSAIRVARKINWIVFEVHAQTADLLRAQIKLQQQQRRRGFMLSWENEQWKQIAVAKKKNRF